MAKVLTILIVLSIGFGGTLIVWRVQTGNPYQTALILIVLGIVTGRNVATNVSYKWEDHEEDW